MSEIAQQLIVGVAVVTAAAFVLRKYVIKKKGANSGACGQCGSCGSNAKSRCK